MKLAKIRIIFSALLFILFLLLFFGGEKPALFLSSFLFAGQFVPALIHLCTKPEILFALGLIFLLVLSLIFGRLYCSFLCPLGTLQDIFIALSGKTGHRRNHSFRKPQNWIRYSVLIFTLLTAACGIMSLINLLDPYSIFARTMTHLLEPLAVWAYNAAIGLLHIFDIYVFDKKLPSVPPVILSVTLGFILIIGGMSVSSGRLYCNTLCPVGTLLGLISRISFFQLALNRTTCNSCGRCANVCKAGCINTQEMTIDQSRCVNCFNCLEACPQSSICYSSSWGKLRPSNWSPARRGFLAGTAAAAGSIFLLLNWPIRLAVGTAGTKTNAPITPPGSVSRDHFTNACTACHLCISACPTKVITPALLEYGVAGIMQPRMNYAESYCDYECNICGRICPTGAILPLALEEKKFTQIGEADLIQDRCIVYINNENCGACGEVCPTHTISFVNKNNILYPETDVQYCIGCGACEKVCPTAPKSIIVNARQQHQRAAKYSPLKQEIQKKPPADKGFPF